MYDSELGPFGTESTSKVNVISHADYIRAFDLQRMNEVVNDEQNRKIIPEICGPLVYEGDLAFFFGPPNVGKTPFALCIAEQFCGGSQLIPELPCSTENSYAIVYDFELSGRQQANRYRPVHGVSSYTFHPRLLRSEYREGINVPAKEYTSTLVDYIAAGVRQYETKLVILDNITALGAQGEKAFDASNLIRILKTNIVKKAGATVIVIAHTPKLNPATPLTMDSMAGSAAFRNLADSVFSIAGSTQGPFRRRVQQHKSRNNPDGRLRYGSENNLIVDSYKRDDGLITYRYIGEAPESEHLPRPEGKEERNEKHTVIEELIRANPQESDRRIAEKAGLNSSSGHKMVSRVRNKLSEHMSEMTHPYVRVNDEQRWWDA